ncbi:hypothetical protein [Mucilaginibacter sp. UYCu711]|uniref:hypothetical protein n=1 Tax=Mucilaginibacter sp. UYCu711 TaxID=3156339 RepID=UPI003D2049B0
MGVDVNYWWVGVIILGAIILITWLIKRDRKDEKVYEEEIIKSEIKPEQHTENNDSDVSP